MSGKLVRMDPKLRSAEAAEFERELASRVIGQERAVRTVARALQTWRVGLTSVDKPAGSFLLLGPTGVGKTRLVSAMAEILFNNPYAILKIDCAEFQREHEIAKLIGSPPGYVGFGQEPRLTNKALRAHHPKKKKDELPGRESIPSLVLFDEIEKASEALYRLLLGMLDSATLMTGRGEEVYFSDTMVFFTSNLASREMADFAGGGIGFHAPATETGTALDKKLYRTAKTAIEKHFSPEFINRLDRTIVFHSLERHHVAAILEVELKKIQDRITYQAPYEKNFVLRVTRRAKEFLLDEGFSPKYGARNLKRALERHIMAPIANFMDTQQINLGDIVTVDYNPAGELAFWNKEGGLFIQPTKQQQGSNIAVVDDGS